MLRLKAANNAVTKLAQDISTVVDYFDVEDGSLFPGDSFLITIDDEIMEVGTRTGNAFSDILRSREGTSAATHNVGAKVENRFTAGTYADLVSAIDAVEVSIGDISSALDLINGEEI